jgi:hypothetical protein
MGRACAKVGALIRGLFGKPRPEQDIDLNLNPTHPSLGDSDMEWKSGLAVDGAKCAIGACLPTLLFTPSVTV